MAFTHNVTCRLFFCILLSPLIHAMNQDFIKPGILSGGTFSAKQLAKAQKLLENQGLNPAGIALPHFKKPSAPVRRPRKASKELQIILETTEQLDPEPGEITQDQAALELVQDLYYDAFVHRYGEDFTARSAVYSIINSDGIIDDERTRRVLSHYRLLEKNNRIFPGVKEAMIKLLPKKQ